METVQQYFWSMVCQISNNIYFTKIFLESGRDQCEYETVDGLLDSGSDTSSICGYAWAIVSLPKR